MDTKYQIELAKEALNSYFATDIVVKDFSQIPVEIRLAFVQKTPAAFIRSRVVGKNKKGENIEVPYIDHFYAEKALNFISNFNWGSEKISSEIETTTTKKGQTMYVASVEMKCWLVFPNGNRIERYVASGHNMYENPAITKADALQSAISKAHTKFARQFGIGTNVQSQEEKAYQRVGRHYDVVDVVSETPEATGDAEGVKEGESTTPKKQEVLGGVQHDTEGVEKAMTDKEKLQLEIYNSYLLKLEEADTEYKINRLVKTATDKALATGLITVSQHDEFKKLADTKIKSFKK